KDPGREEASAEPPGFALADPAENGVPSDRLFSIFTSDPGVQRRRGRIWLLLGSRLTFAEVSHETTGGIGPGGWPSFGGRQAEQGRRQKGKQGTGGELGYCLVHARRQTG